MDKHSPTPWRLELDEAWPEFTDYPIRDANGDPVVQTDSGCYPPDNATAALIVEAVNEHVARHRMIDISTYDHICTENDRLRDLVRRMMPCVDMTIGTLELNVGEESGFPISVKRKFMAKSAELRALRKAARKAVGEGEL